MAFEHLIKLSLSLTLLSVYVLGQHSVVRFDKEEIKGIVKMHNDLRRSIYNAANMRELSWNEAVAMAASEWGTECEYVTRPDHHWGQNMNYFYGGDYHKSALDLFTDSFNTWANETVHYDYRRYRSCGRKNVCSYVQLIAAEAEQVGCSIVKCPRLQLKDPYGIQTHAKLLVCFYTPWIDINNKEVFIPEERCSACPTGTVCVDNLCSGRFSGEEPHKHNSIGESRINIGISSISGSRPDPKDKKGLHQAKPSRSQTQRENRGHGRHTDIIVNEIVRNPDSASANKAEQRKTSTSNKAYEDHVVIYTPNNRVVPFPGKKESRDIRRIEKYERKLERKKKKDKKKKKSKKQAELFQKPEKVAAASSIHTANGNQTALSRKKRQLSYEDAVYMRRLEHHRYLKEQREREIQERERRRQYEEQIRRRNDHNRRHRQMMELRRLSDNQRSMNNQRVIDNQRLIDGRRLTDEQRLIEARRISDEQRRIQEERERRRQRRLREQRKRQELMALLQSEGELTGEEQFNTISAHNILRRADGARELSWSSHLEKWAKYVIRCETEYPGPISCSTNFGKANGDQEIYNVVYEWGAEGNDLRQPLRYGCRTPYDQSLCNHNSILRDKSLKQMACAAKNCGLQRQLTCIYNSS